MINQLIRKAYVVIIIVRISVGILMIIILKLISNYCLRGKGDKLRNKKAWI